jgi:hypothetical protein
VWEREVETRIEGEDMKMMRLESEKGEVGIESRRRGIGSGEEG